MSSCSSGCFWDDRLLDWRDSRCSGEGTLPARGGGSGAAEPSACGTAVRDSMGGALGSASQADPDAGQDISRPLPPPARGLPGSCCGSSECIVRQNIDRRERYCCQRLNALYCPHCGLWLCEFDEGKSRNWTRGQWGDKSPVARDGVTLGCKACVAACEREEAAIRRRSLEEREGRRQELQTQQLPQRIVTFSGA